MRGLGIAVTICVLLSAAFFVSRSDSPTRSLEAPTQTNPAPKTTNESFLEVPTPTQKAASQPSPRKEFAIKLQKLSGLIRQDGLEPDELIHRILNEGFDSVQDDLSPELRTSFKELHKAAEELNSKQLKADGFSPDFFSSRPNISLPPSVRTRRRELDEIYLDQKIRSFVDYVAQAEEVLDEDIHELAQLCRLQKNCIEKAVTEWIDSNHLLSEAQLSRLEILMEAKQ